MQKLRLDFFTAEEFLKKLRLSDLFCKVFTSDDFWISSRHVVNYMTILITDAPLLSTQTVLRSRVESELTQFLLHAML